MGKILYTFKGHAHELDKELYEALRDGEIIKVKKNLFVLRWLIRQKVIRPQKNGRYVSYTQDENFRFLKEWFENTGYSGITFKTYLEMRLHGIDLDIPEGEVIRPVTMDIP